MDSVIIELHIVYTCLHHLSLVVTLGQIIIFLALIGDVIQEAVKVIQTEVNLA